MDRRRVVVTGLGALSPVGHNVAETWQSMVEGKTGVGPVTHFDASSHASKIAAEVKDFNPKAFLSGQDVRRDPFIQFALIVAREAMAQSGLTVDDSNAARVGVVFGTGIGGIHSWDKNFHVMLERGPERVSPLLIPMLITNMAAGFVSIDHGAQGPSKCVQSACATSAHCIGDGMRMIQYGEADAVIVGGSEAAIEPLACAGFDQMRAFSRRNDEPEKASRPFDLERDGFIMGEGAGALILEEYEHAKARGAEILAEMVGYGTTSDAYHMAAPHPCGNGAAQAMRQALVDSKLTPGDVGYINCHATSTPAGDIAEVNAIKQVFANGDAGVPASSTKGVTGHLLGAAGAVEMVAAIMALREGVLPPTINQEVPDPECDIDCVPNEAREAKVDVVMSNGFGFGGHNCTLVARRV